MEDEFGKDISAGELASILPAFGMARAGVRRFTGGTASPKVRLEIEGNSWLCRRRRREFSAPNVVRFDHDVMRHLTESGLPVFPPLRTPKGKTAVFFAGRAYEIFPFVEGLEAMADRDEQIRQAGLTLGRMHAATRKFIPTGEKPWPREFHIGRNCQTLTETIDRLGHTDPQRTAVARRLLAETHRVADVLTDDRVACLPQVIGHGDYTAANVFFRGDEVAAIFDFDWTSRQTRLDDVARGIVFLAFPRREPLIDGDIRSLVAAWQGDAGKAERFVRAVGEVFPLTAEEWELLPFFVRETWFGARIRAMRKVPDGQKLDLLTHELSSTLDWLAKGCIFSEKPYTDVDRGAHRNLEE